MLSTRLVPDHDVVPLGRPVQSRGVAGLAVVRKLVPDTVTLFMFVPVVAMVNDTVAVTVAAFLTLLDSTTEGAVSVPHETPAIDKDKNMKNERDIDIFFLEYLTI